MSASCLLIVDVQKGFINEATAHIPEQVERAQYDFDVVAATRFINRPDSFYHRLLDWHRFDACSEDVSLAFVARPDARLWDKYGYSGITPDFLDWLTSQDIKIVHLCGMDTDICVTKCAVDLFEAGIEPVVLSNLCASHAGTVAHDHALKTLARFIGKNQLRLHEA